MRLTSFEQWKQWAEEAYTLLPYIEKHEIPGKHRVDSWESAWQAAAECSFVLESGKAGRFTYLGLRPESTIWGKGEEAHVESGFSKTAERWEGNPLQLVKRWMNASRVPAIEDTPPWLGGCVGYWGYDVVRSIEKLPGLATDELSIPDYYFMRINELWIIDHETEQLYCAVHLPLSAAFNTGASLSALYEQAARQAREMKNFWERLVDEKSDLDSRLIRAAETESGLYADPLHIDVEAIEGVERRFDKEKYMRAVTRIQEYIRQGDVFQVNLSVRQSRELRTRPETVYECLRRLNPSPYMSFMRFPGFQFVSASPELLVKSVGRKVGTRPIAGTRPRGKNREEDMRLAEELIHNEKERAEHIMLVDLERNDIGRICSYGTVKVDDFMVIETYSHVMHIVSEVKGELAEGKDAFDIIAATFPGGTITGAPKVRTMEIIEELEPVRRGPYTGSIGWIDYNGNMEFNIIIRTLFVADGIGHIQAGAGIVIDSDPEREYYESLNKAKALWKAIERSEQLSCSSVALSDV